MNKLILLYFSANLHQAEIGEWEMNRKPGLQQGNEYELCSNCDYDYYIKLVYKETDIIMPINVNFYHVNLGPLNVIVLYMNSVLVRQMYVCDKHDA